jgi:S-formylglutathione hydrolase FrmB
MGRLVTRRAVLFGGLGLGVAGVAAGAGMITDVLPGGPALRRALGLTGQDGSIPDVPPSPVSVERVRSAARGRDVDLMITSPDGVSPAGLPVCLALHGRGASARWFLDLGIPQFLTAAVRSGTPPFAVAAVDGGDSYYLPNEPDDPQRMLLDELPRWLADRGLPAPMAALGISMGGFGALNLARRRRDLRAVAVASAALFISWSDAKSRNVFRDEPHWSASEPLRHTADLTGVPLGIWCGTEDPFLDATRELIGKTHPELAAITPGAHTSGYWRRIFPDMIRFVGTRLA